MRYFSAIFFLGFFLLTACATIPTKDIAIDSDADQRVHFTNYNSYGWLAAAGIMNDPEGKWEPPGYDVDAEIKFIIDRELRKRGWTENTSNPDLYVAYVVGVDMAALKLQVKKKTRISTLENVPAGALLVVLIDAESGMTVWAGEATAELQEGLDMETRKKRLDYTITKMLKQVPSE